MNTSQVNKALKDVPIFKGTFARDKLPTLKQRPLAIVANTDKHDEPGEHWVAIILLPNKKGEYFDPLGLPPLHEEFVKYLKKHCSNGWVYNRTTVQKPSSKVCGPFCIHFIKARYKKIKYQKFLNRFSGNLAKNEQKVRNGRV